MSISHLYDLALSMISKNISRQHLYDSELSMISKNISHVKVFFLGKKRKNIISLSSAESAQTVVRLIILTGRLDQNRYGDSQKTVQSNMKAL